MSLRSIASLDYVVLPCRDLQAMRDFYRDIMGFAIAYERADWIRFQIGTTALALRPLDGAFRGRRVEGPAVQIAFRVGHGAVDACHEELTARGVAVLDPPRDQAWRHRTLFFADPEGNLLEIYAELPDQDPE